MGLNQFRVLAPHESLKRDIECLLLYEFNGKEPTTTIESIQVQSGHKVSPPTLFVYGPVIESSVMSFGIGSYTVIQVVLKPHALKALFGINALILKNASVELNEFSSEDINEQLINAHCAQDQANLLTKFLMHKLKEIETRDELVEESLFLIQMSDGLITVRSLLEYLDISERQFERRFSQTVGISPFAYIRLKRFNEALRLMKTRQYDTLTEIAYALKFHDQSHFIRDIKAFTGVTPKSLSQKVDDFYHNQAGYSY
jgi:AraC-like DNA-binding protein